MFKKFAFNFFGVILSLAIIVIAFNVNLTNIASLPQNAVVTFEDIETINNENIFGKFITSNISDIQVGNDNHSSGKMWLKLFGFLPLKQIDVQISKGEGVYVGGIPLGFAIKTKGLLVVGNNSVLTDSNSKQDSALKNGDIIQKVNGITINNIEDFTSVINNCDKCVTLTIIRDNIEQEIDANLVLDNQTNTQKIGVWVKDNANGIGTLTYVKIFDKTFGALGHAITDFETGTEIPIQNGNIYKCTLIGITKAEKNHPGEMRCVFLQGINHKGKIEKNTKFGVYGEVSDLNSVVDYNLTADVGSRLAVKTGKAKLVSAVSGMREEYDIEIIKTSYQPKSSDKSFIFRVTDSRLLQLTGGIVQGMSGSPILQNGKLIGAVTHVFVNDSSKGYGIYSDWMLA